MFRNRFLILLGLCFLAASAAWADDVGYVDCSKNSDATQVFAKPRKSQEVVGSMPCGERFTILVYGFFFSKIQTKDGQVGFIYSSLIAIDRAAASVPQPRPQTGQQTPSLQSASEKTKIPRATPFDAPPKPSAASQIQPTAAQPVAAQSASTPAPVVAAPASASNAPETTPAKPEANPPATVAAEVQPAPVQPGTTSPAGLTTPATTSPAPVSNVPEAAAAVAQPNPPAAQPDPPSTAQPEAAAAQPEPAPAIRPADARTSWEKPRPSIRSAPLLELYGGYAFARLAGGGAYTNMNGVLGSFGWNPKPWLQVVADTSYSFTTTGGAKNVLFGNHFGPRFFYRRRNRWGITPFVEGLVGGSSAKTTVSGVGGYTSSTGSTLSYKAGGGLDIHPSRRWEIRLFDVDYYRTSFGTNLHQNNYWVSTGVILRLFSERDE